MFVHNIVKNIIFQVVEHSVLCLRFSLVQPMCKTKRSRTLSAATTSLEHNKKWKKCLKNFRKDDWNLGVYKEIGHNFLYIVFRAQ